MRDHAMSVQENSTPGPAEVTPLHIPRSDGLREELKNDIELTHDHEKCDRTAEQDAVKKQQHYAAPVPPLPPAQIEKEAVSNHMPAPQYCNCCCQASNQQKQEQPQILMLGNV